MTAHKRSLSSSGINIATLRGIFALAGVKLRSFIGPIALSFVVALLEGTSVTLLLFLAKGVVKMNFTFLKETPVFSTVIGALSLFVPISNTVIFASLVLLIFSVVLLKNIFQYFSSLSIAFQMRKLCHNLRTVVFDRYLEFGKLFFDRNSEAHMRNTVLIFTRTITQYFMDVHNLLSNVFMVAVYLAIMFTISLKLTVMVVVLSPVFYYSLRWLIEKIRKTSKYYVVAQNILSAKLADVFGCINLVKAYSNEQREKENFNYNSEALRKWEYSLDKKYNLINPLQEITILVVILLLISFVAFVVTKEKKELAGFLVYFYILKKLANSFSVINNFRGNLAMVSGPAEEIAGVFSDKDKFFVYGGNQEFNGLHDSINFNRLNFSYIPEKVILKNLSFSVEKGRMLAIVGHTGAGKTTIINLLMRFYDCPPASIFIDGTDIRRFSLTSLRAHIALVSQDMLLLNDTIKNNIIYGIGRDVSDEELADVSRKAYLYDFIKSLPEGFNTYIGDRGVKLSGGEKQRLSIARALLKGSEILILDEATSSLDTATERLIQAAINEAVKGRTTIVIAHRLSTIRHADKIVVIENGVLAEEGGLDHLLKSKGAFYRYWEEQKFY